ncbi:MAG: hypothetical protein WKF57_10140 [Nakamurella sp.]
MSETLAQRRRRRRFSVIITLACGVATAIGCITVNAVLGSPVLWFWLLAAPLYVTLLMSLFLWIRLAPSA